MNLSVVILNYNRPNFVKKDIINSLNKISIIDEIIISHGKKETLFTSKNPKVKSLFHYGKMNEEYGLTLRFISGLEAKNEHIIIMDDDIIPSEEAVLELFENIKKDERIYGIYGRDPTIEYNVQNVFGTIPIVLTRCLITTKSMCKYFIENYKKFENDDVKNSKPFWNGEDILFSLLSIKMTNKLPISLDLKHYNYTYSYLNLKNSISLGGPDHLKYRKKITNHFISKLELTEKISKETNIISKGNNLVYFIKNSNLGYFILLGLSLIIFLLIKKFKVLKWYQNIQK